MIVPSCGTNSGADRSNWWPGQQPFATTSFSALRGSIEIASRLASSAVRPSAVESDPRARDDVTHCLSAMRWAANRYRSGPWSAGPTCHGSPAHRRACASFAVDRPIGPSLPQRACVPAGPKLNKFRLGAKPPAVAGREEDRRQGRGQRSSPNARHRHQCACNLTQAAMSVPIFTR